MSHFFKTIGLRANESLFPTTQRPLLTDLQMLLDRLQATGFNPPITTDGQPIVIPATGQLVGHLPFSTPDQYETAIVAAENASEELSIRLSDRHRGEFFLKLAERIEYNRDALTRLLTCLNKTQVEAGIEIDESIAVLRLNAGTCFQPNGTLYASNTCNEELQVRWVPLGKVSAQLAVCNFPVSITLKHLIASLSAGVSQVVKAPDAGGALAILYLKELFDTTATSVGFPKDSFSVLIGDKELGKQLSNDSRFCTIAATGSNEMVYAIRQAAAVTGANTVLEGSGHNMVVALSPQPSQELMDCVDSAIGGMGALRCSTTHTLVTSPDSASWAHPLLVASSTKFTQTAGDPRHPNTRMTALYSRRHLDQFNAEKKQATAKAEREVPIGTPQLPPEFEGGFWPKPALFSFPPNATTMRPFYGPAWNQVIMTTPDDTWRLLQDQKEALTNAIFTSNPLHIREFLRTSRSGISNINTPPNGNPVGTEAGFLAGTSTSGTHTSPGAGSIRGRQAYQRPVFSRVALPALRALKYLKK